MALPPQSPQAPPEGPSNFDKARRDLILDPRTTPLTFQDFVGQVKAKTRLQVAVEASKRRGDLLGHILLEGPDGFGRSTLSLLAASTCGRNIHTIHCSRINEVGEIIGVFTNLEEQDVVICENLELLPKKICGSLESALGSFQLDVVIDQGENSRPVRLSVPHFTLVGTTKNMRHLPRALTSTFSTVETLVDYRTVDLWGLTLRLARILECRIEDDAVQLLVRAGVCSASDILRRLRGIQDYALVTGHDLITISVAAEALTLLDPEEATNESSPSRTAIPSEVRREIWRRDEGRCTKCGSRENLEYDHIIPFSRGGSNTARNIELLCESCNRAKSDIIV